MVALQSRLREQRAAPVLWNIDASLRAIQAVSAISRAGRNGRVAMRRAAKVDSTHRAIAERFIAHGWSAVSTAALGKGFPDLLVARSDGFTAVVEAKTGKEDLNALQVAWRRKWLGKYYTVRTVEEVDAICQQ